MASRKDIEAQIAALQAELEGADEDVELWVEHDRGGKMVKTRLSGSHAKSWLDDLLGTGAEVSEEGEKEPEKKTYFKRK